MCQISGKTETGKMKEKFPLRTVRKNNHDFKNCRLERFISDPIGGTCEMAHAERIQDEKDESKRQKYSEIISSLSLS